MNEDFFCLDDHDHKDQVIFYKKDRAMYVSESYIEDIFGQKDIWRSHWCGLTRDYNTLFGPFATLRRVLVDANDSLEDLKQYDLNKVKHPEILKHMRAFFEEAVERDEYVFVREV